MKKLLIFICCTMLLSCGHNNQAMKTSLTENNVVEEATPTDTIDENAGGETLNDIRFAGWGKKELADNDYIRAVRKYIDNYNSGKIENTDLDEPKKYIQGELQLRIYHLT